MESRERVRRIETRWRRFDPSSNLTLIPIVAGGLLLSACQMNSVDRGRQAEANTRSKSVNQQSAATNARFTNSLEMVFLEFPATRLKVCIWETRVKDFAEFVAQTGYDATAGMYSPGRDGWQQRGHNWLYPGFSQTLLSPVCGINSFDAIAFCEWLTTRERQRGVISGHQQYRLPTTEEWFSYAGQRPFPWGNAYPPLSAEGAPLANVGGEDIRDGNWPETSFVIQGYKDGYPRTSPVGSFPPNELGIFDTGGNIKEWSSDWYPEGRAKPQADSEVTTSSTSQLRVLLGSGWATALRDQLASRISGAVKADDRLAGFGFRIVLAEN